jgi:large subunit ribosomal protein L23
MALFGKKKESAKKETKTTSKALPTDRNLDGVILSSRLTEKSVTKSEQNVYTFVIHKDATKYQVRDAVKALYNVTPVKINIVNKQPAKRLKGSRGRLVHKAGMKKAYVYLKRGDTISIV